MTFGAGSTTIGARLAAIVERLPDNVAVVEKDTQVSYRQFDRAATAIARQLLAVAEGRRGCVCLFFTSKLPALESTFGAGRIGRTYVALDAGDPEERLRFILEDCDPVALLTESSLLDRARALAPAGCTVVNVAHLPPNDDARPMPDVAADATLYLCYTSGSTGRPKGVSQTHANLLFFADTYASALQIGAADRLSLLYALSFNAANLDIYGGLLCGATICAYDMRQDGVARLADWLDRRRITILHAVPTVFRELCKRLPPGRILPYLKTVDLGGESVFASDVEQFVAHTSENCVLINQLASTEVGLIAQHVVGRCSPLHSGSIVPVGRCPEGVRVTIRREDGNAANTDEVGEMFIGSAHVSPGYWRRPELDAAAFAESPQQPGWRQYASGDFGRIDVAGDLHFLGRRGGRVKIRGHSVELMEIEAALSACPGVMKAAVVATGSERDAETERVVAYVMTRDAADRVPQRIRRHLATRLPSYMLPAGFVFVDALPLTASGKIDRLALTRIEPPAENAARDFALPQDDVERSIAGIFEQLLKLAPIGRSDDFFLLGGDSLLGVELQARLSDAFGVRVGSFHVDATVERIAANIRRAGAAQLSACHAFPVLFPLWEQGSAPPMFLIHGRHGQAFVSPHFMQLLGDDQPVWAFQARGLDGMQSPHTSVEDMAEDYLAEIRKQQPRGPYFIAALCAGTYIAAVMARSLREAGEWVLPLLLFDPPDRLLQGGYSQMTEEQFVSKMKARNAMGRTAGPVDDPTYMKAVLRVALAFENAIGSYRPQPYDGAVYMLSSRQRTLGADPAGLRLIFSGRIERFEVGTTHAEALDPRNPVFARALLHCVGRIHAAARADIQVRSECAANDRS